MINALFIKRLVLFLLLIYGCRLGQLSNTVNNDRLLSRPFSHLSCLEAFDFTRPNNFINGKVKAFFCKNCPMWC